MLVIFFSCKKDNVTVQPTVQANIPPDKFVTISGNNVLLLFFKDTTISNKTWNFNSMHLAAANLTANQIAFITDSLQREFNRKGADLLVTTDVSFYKKALRKQVAIITKTSAWYNGNYGNENGGTGTCYIGSWMLQAGTPFFVFPALLGNNSGDVIRTIFHEFGHSVGLYHSKGVYDSKVNYDWMSESSLSFGFTGYYGNPTINQSCKLIYEQDVLIKALQ